jgi:hypothetical protein
LALKPLTPAITTPTTPPRCSLGPYKRRRAPSALTIPFPLSPELPRAFLRPHAELKPSLFFASVASPLRRRSCSCEHPSGTASSGSSSSTAADEHRRSIAPVRCPGTTSPSCLRRLDPRWTRATLPGPQAVDPLHQIFHWKINPRIP